MKLKPNFIHLFPISRFKGKSFKYIRIRQTMVTMTNRNYLLMSSIELFGYLLGSEFSLFVKKVIPKLSFTKIKNMIFRLYISNN